MALLALQSERLRAVPVARLSPQDRDALFEPEVVTYLPDGFQGLETDAARCVLLDGVQQEAEVVALSTRAGEVIGLLILSHGAAGDRLRHLGYLFVRATWGQGYASEMLRALQDLYRGQPVVLSGGVMADNAASARVLQKNGFVRGAPSEAGEVTYTWDAERG
ncbi:GNAT family N-acetyltransferase [Tritonibacter sp. SIMBA_163]|uniref:GNAT family N-acetyltransferase n=1 Tax=Tritonibacter sp. SIMBA_163 TaxID=3080868 RepID=UPI0039806613